VRLLTEGSPYVWVANALGDSVTRIDPGTNETISVTVPDEPVSLSAGYGSVWVATAGGGQVVRLNLDATVRDTVDVGGAPSAIRKSDPFTAVASPRPARWC
jgi:DNA-binding beta-propeller fold protein YncE